MTLLESVAAPASPRPDGEVHAIQRARERYGLELQTADLARIRAWIKEGLARRLWTDVKTGVSCYEMQFRGETVRPLYCPRLDAIKTFYAIPPPAPSPCWQKNGFGHAKGKKGQRGKLGFRQDVRKRDRGYWEGDAE